MDLKEYLNRIGFTGQHDKADLDNLFTIHKLHVMNIPFENLSIHSGEKNTMDLHVIYDKIVKSNRGGWCCENNLLFSWVLKEMGYEFTILGSKVYNSQEKEFLPLDSHIINLVEVDGKQYIADVSFGVSCQIWHPLELISGIDQPQPPGVFRLINNEIKWVLEKTGRKQMVKDKAFANSSLIDKRLTKTLYTFTLTPRNADHFREMSQTLQTSPDSLFMLKSICSLQTATGFRALIGWTYSEVTFKDDSDLVDMKEIPDSEIEALLRDKFNLVLVKKFTPKNNKASYCI
ncbi:arylamine N-acetyltransferase, pineal gland isozyme NAT-10-like [Puntigrus tetrazona]|uniref:arylamine N-acetyltransferase, pineal gland isozyme NAT-10-like n=1 Tax=Puntigrus tetrazona TaxID=1606681 RepID=UPI001C89B051|nr:arylamine N-acetyltransferase, pineal gland isozyme NAT-10-like [Puntigrus tetrazona]XP_043101787.1 arylamine N-acetyltransferase, pineal gland isozyme NAT-10-like [Puntigrus tetrazona]